MTGWPRWTAPALWFVTVIGAAVVIYWPGAEAVARSPAWNVLAPLALLAVSVLLAAPRGPRMRVARRRTPPADRARPPA